MIIPSLFNKVIYHSVKSCLQDWNNSGGAVERMPELSQELPQAENCIDQIYDC